MADIRAITLRQPWAYAVGHCGKDVENRRKWLGLITGPVLIHAAKEWDDDWLEAVELIAKLSDRPGSEVLAGARVFGSVIAVATIPKKPMWPHGSHACVRTSHLAHLHPDGPYTCSPWAMGGNGGMSHYPLRDVQPLRKPVPARGALGFWRPPADVLAAVREQVAIPEAEETADA